MKSGGGEDAIAQGSRGYSITADDEGLAIRAPLGTTRVEWLAVDGPFTAWPDGTVRFRMKPEFLARRSALFRIGVRLGRGMGVNGLRVFASPYGTTEAELAAALNERLAERVGRPPPVDQATRLGTQGVAIPPLRRLVGLSTWIAVAAIVFFFFVRHVI